MMNLKLKNLVFSILILLFILNCSSPRNKISGKWKVSSLDRELNEGIQKLELNPSLIDKSFKALFPKELNKGDIIEVIGKDQLIHKNDTFSIDVAKSYLDIKVYDAIYELNILMERDRIILTDTISLGYIKWILVRH